MLEKFGVVIRFCLFIAFSLGLIGLLWITDWIDFFIEVYRQRTFRPRLPKRIWQGGW
jgi:hypothetical protein